MADEPLLVVHPSGWNYFWHWVFCWLIVPLIIALVRRASLELRVYRDRVELETGLLSKDLRELRIADIRSVDIQESFLQRLLHIGTISISSAGAADSVIVAAGIPNPRRVRTLLQELRNPSATSVE